ncbi:unnamed protein product [Pleuronectes platessa]|uniref:Uncharacterized protein n=1 Tax=Pleuronectes platessa TaxID=8262 RepID=A0A9N7TYF2_PLEPL|nr:unnamed protein product [Pleuronectes platessa]
MSLIQPGLTDVGEKVLGPLNKPRDPSSRLSWRESSFLTAMSQNQSAQTTEFFSQDVFNQLFDMLDQSAIHSVQPIELNFTESPTDGSTGNTIQISMDCITMHKPDETLSVRGLCSLELVINGPTPTAHFPLHQRGVWCADWHASNSASIPVVGNPPHQPSPSSYVELQGNNLTQHLPLPQRSQLSSISTCLLNLKADLWPRGLARVWLVIGDTAFSS